MIVTLAAFVQLAASCAPSVAVETLAAIARHESGLNDTAIYDNTAKRSYTPASSGEAIAVATELVVVQRHSVDLGLMQVNSANLRGLGLSVTDAFDTCQNIKAGARILAAAYVPPGSGDTQPALIQALSRYNTGNPERGIANGYVARVQAAAEQVVPAIRLRAEAVPAARSSVAPVTTEPLSPPPPAWDVFAQAAAARGRQPKPRAPQSVVQPSPQQTADAR